MIVSGFKLWIDRWSVDDAARWEGVAAGLLEEAGADDEAMDPRALASACGLRLVPVMDSAGGGACTRGKLIRFPAAARAVRQAGTIAHELGHVALDRYDEEQSEPGAAYVGAALLVPRRALDRALRRHGWELDALRAVFPFASAELLARRIAELREAVVTIFDGRRVKARIASPWLAPPPKGLTRIEREVLEEAWAAGEAHADLVRAWRLHEPGHDRVIIIADAEQLALRF